MYCSFCGAKIPENSKFCTSCGKDLSKITLYPSNPNYVPAADESKAKPLSQKPSNQPELKQEKVKAEKIKKEKIKKERKPIDKKLLINLVFLSIITLLYATITILPIIALGLEESVMASTIFDSDFVGEFGTDEFLGLLTDGNRIFNPTVFSGAYGLATYIFIYALPVFAVISLVSLYMNKKVGATFGAFSTFAVISSALLGGLAFVTAFIKVDFKAAVAVEIGATIGDVDKLYSVVLPVLFAVTVVLLAVTRILIGILKKRRAENEK